MPTFLGNHWGFHSRARAWDKTAPAPSSNLLPFSRTKRQHDSGAAARKSAAQKPAALLPPRPSATRCIQQRSQSCSNTIFGRCQATEISNCRAYENQATHNGETSYAEEGMHTHPHSDHMKFERRYEAAESMIKLLSVAKANFRHLMNFLQTACLRMLRAHSARS